LFPKSETNRTNCFGLSFRFPVVRNLVPEKMANWDLSMMDEAMLEKEG
jgi:hypothetical protein